MSDTETTTEVLTGESVTLNELAEKLTSLLGEKKYAALIAHSRPDGDTAGSCAGMCRLLASMGYTADWICADTIPMRLRLYNDREDHTIEAVFPGWVGDDGSITVPDDVLVISLDTAEYKLMGDDYAVLFENRVDIKLDHHYSGTPFGRYSHIDGDIGSCGELCVMLANAMPSKPVIPADAATLFFAAISSDTGGFKYTNATAVTHRVAADLMDLGADTDYVAQKLYGQRSPKDIAALGLAFSHVTYRMDGRIGLLTVTVDEFTSLGLTNDDLGEFASIPRDIQGVEIGITVKQSEDNLDNYKISMRSNGADVSLVCGLLGGGGHVRASGAMVVADSMEEAVDMILRAVVESGVLESVGGAE